MTLDMAKIGNTNTIISVKTEDPELNSFLLTLGCYPGEKITVVSMLSDNYVVSIKDGRYNIDRNIASSIVIE